VSGGVKALWPACRWKQVKCRPPDTRVWQLHTTDATTARSGWGSSGYTLLASFRSATASSDAVAANLQVEAAIGFAAAVTFGCLVVTVLHRYS
jgi:hypothetical protein